MRGFLVVLAAGIVAAAVAAGGSDLLFAGTGPATVRITAEAERITKGVDTGRLGMSPGDTQIVRETLYNRHITQKPIGHAEFVCTFTDGRSRLCNGTFFLPKGKLMVEGPLRYRQFYELAIVGGTELYDNARGSLTMTRLSSDPVRTLALFRLVG
jgi:hypothetical protein